MNETFYFRPPRQRGIMFHSVVIVALGATSAMAFLIGLSQKANNYFLLLMFISLLLFAPLPWIIYRAYALSRAEYRLERDGLRLRWGLRAEDIPLPDIEWVRRSTDLAADLPLPRFPWPGAILGMVHTADLGLLEYLASTNQNMLLIATPRRVYVISPEDPEAFLARFQRTLEMGSLTPISFVSILPAAYANKVWTDAVARWLLVASFLLTLLLFILASLLAPGRALISLGFYPNGAPLPPVPSAQLLLLPILGAFLFVIDLATGLYFYRQESGRQIAYLVWGSASITALLLIAAVLFILTSPV